MATSAQLVSEARPRVISLHWIISARDDLVWFIGSVASSYLLLALYLSGAVPLVPLVALWAILIDAPHVFGTFSRTYFDKNERRSRGRLLWGSLLFFVVGPVMVWLGASLVFFFLAALWAYYHLVKQHYGFMVLYKKKNGDLAAVDNTLDRALLLFAFNYPFVAFIAEDPEAMARVPLSLQSAVNSVASLLLAGTIVLGLLWIARQIQRVWLGQPLNLPKYLLLAAAIPMHWIVLLTPMPHKPIAIVAILTIYHNFQYHRLIWFHNKKYSVGEDCKERFGAAELISRRLLFYVAFGIIFGVIYQGPRQYLGYLSLGSERGLLMELGIAFLWGNAFIHYYLDSKIWRVRHDKAVGRALRME
ncbi:MAG TPA: hypothetical protein VMM84_04235 [Pyrinomonadaceae bacterium]|nr:hypothetical protein [Pyrinomonadaceae bacterium]